MCEQCEHTQAVLDGRGPNFDRAHGAVFYLPVAGEEHLLILSSDYADWLDTEGAVAAAAGVRAQLGDVPVSENLMVLATVEPQTFDSNHLVANSAGVVCPVGRWDTIILVSSVSVPGGPFPAWADALSLEEVPIDETALLNGIATCECGYRMYAFGGAYYCPGFDLAEAVSA